MRRRLHGVIVTACPWHACVGRDPLSALPLLALTAAHLLPRTAARSCGVAQVPAGTVLRVFGSSANGFGLETSDLDMCLIYPQVRAAPHSIHLLNFKHIL
jgi:Nucleotidyltransferase domain